MPDSGFDKWWSYPAVRSERSRTIQASTTKGVARYIWRDAQKAAREEDGLDDGEDASLAEEFEIPKGPWQYGEAVGGGRLSAAYWVTAPNGDHVFYSRYGDHASGLSLTKWVRRAKAMRHAVECVNKIHRAEVVSEQVDDVFQGEPADAAFKPESAEDLCGDHDSAVPRETSAPAPLQELGPDEDMRPGEPMGFDTWWKLLREVNPDFAAMGDPRVLELVQAAWSESNRAAEFAVQTLKLNARNFSSQAIP